MYSRAFKRFDDQRHYYHTLGIGASGLAYGLQVLWIVVLLFWSELVILTACMMLTCYVVCNTHLQQRTYCVSLISLLKFLKPILCGQVVANYRRLASFWPFVPNRTIPLQYMCWVNLLYNQVVMPEVSFSGHMSGILAGLVHVFLPKAGRSFKVNFPSCIAD